MTAVFANPKLHPGPARVSFTVYGDNGPIAFRMSVVKIPRPHSRGAH